MTYNIRIVSTYPPRRCGIGTFSRDLAGALSHFTGEVGHIRVAAIDVDHLPYNIPVDLVIDQYNPESWKDCTKDIIARAGESIIPTVVLLQHEYGLDPDENGEDGRGTNFVRVAEALAEKNITTFAYLHTVLDEPNDHQKMVIQHLAKSCQALIVTTESAIQILESTTYGIKHDKLKHIDHGIRMQHPSQYDRLAVKKDLGLEGYFLVLSLGLLSPDKGLQYSIRGYGRFLEESVSENQRQQIIYLIAGQCHPEFIKAGGGQPYRQFQNLLEKNLTEANLKWC